MKNIRELNLILVASNELLDKLTFQCNNINAYNRYSIYYNNKLIFSCDSTNYIIDKVHFLFELDCLNLLK